MPLPADFDPISDVWYGRKLQVGIKANIAQYQLLELDPEKPEEVWISREGQIWQNAEITVTGVMNSSDLDEKRPNIVYWRFEYTRNRTHEYWAEADQIMVSVKHCGESRTNITLIKE